MTKHKINIDERLPKLKEKRRKRANKSLMIYLTFFFCLLFLIIYFQSPLSKISSISIYGNNYISDIEIVEASNIKIKETSFLYFDKEGTKNNIENIKELDKIRFERKFPNKLHIYVEELDTVGYISTDSKYFPLLENGEILKTKVSRQPNFSVPILFGWKNSEGLQELAQELQVMNASVRMAISEIHYKPSSTDKQKILLYMNDGNEVLASISSLSDKLNKYPTLVAQLKTKEKGVFHLEVGAYFTPFKVKGEKNENN